ncbi:hypothetical protein MNQ98_19060 [Paenibacillus sp. N3/727]|uniref:hypothetical protein n=1 Tax=Paenibacillus sp. N3/727 TaxID=2925845 RepID=UPI001F532FEB|nr:hypothetical protein [Paenibacillus sp. N3/727]UNK16589.1 hypothetical protein MNQ98_19060 [Paenibacillus sp. N3/727]
MSSIKQDFTCRYAYGRAAETVMLSEKGQDYMAFAIDGGVCSFVLCDGVGLSYRGDFASRFLGRGLLAWLRNCSELSQHHLERELQALATASSQESDRFEVKDNTPQLLKEVLQEKQRLGSEAMYICGRIEQPGRFQRKGKLWLAWQGDSRLRLFNQHMEMSSRFGDNFRTAERWSTRSGPIGGKPHVYECRLDDLTGYRLLMYSDGLNDLDPICDWVPDDQVQVLMNALHTGGLEDDASFLEIVW